MHIQNLDTLTAREEFVRECTDIKHAQLFVWADLGSNPGWVT